MTYYLDDDTHVLIAGATGSGKQYGGKSVLANWWFQQSVEKGHHDVGLFFNPKGLSFVSGGDVRRVRTIQGLAKSYKAGYRLFDYYPSDGGSQASNEPVISFLRHLPGRKIVVHDEAQAFKDAESLNWCLSQGGNMSDASEPTDNIRSLVVTQRPWNLSEELRANMPLKIWVGPVTNECESWFQSEKMTKAVERVRKATDAYHWSVTDAGEYVTTHAPVPEGYA